MTKSRLHLVPFLLAILLVMPYGFPGGLATASADGSGGGPGPGAGAPQGAQPKHQCENGARVGAPPAEGRGTCEKCVKPVVTPNEEEENSIAPSDAQWSIGGSDLAGGSLDPHSGAVELRFSGVGQPILTGGPHDPLPEGGGGFEPSADPLWRPMYYSSQVTMNRAFGNWWFPLDVFVIPQANGDLRYYAPGIVGALYAWNPALGTYVSPPGVPDRMLVGPGGTWNRITKHGEILTFNPNGYLVSSITRFGVGTTITRGTADRVLSFTDYAGRTSAVSYYANGYASAITDWVGRVWSFTYTAAGYLASIESPPVEFRERATGSLVTRPRKVRFQYVGGTGTALDGNLAAILDDAGNSAWNTTYDALDRASSTTSRGRTWHYTFAGTFTRVADPDGWTTDYLLDLNGAIAEERRYTRTGMGLPALRIGEPNYYATTYQRNDPCGCGRVTQITFHDGSAESYTFDSWANLTTRTRLPATGSNQPTTTELWTYAPFTQYCVLLSHRSPGGGAGNVNPAHFTTSYAYDTTGRLLEVTYPRTQAGGAFSQPKTTFTRNAVGLPLTRTSPSGVVTAYEYAPLTFDLLSVTVDAGPGRLNIRNEYAYDLEGRRVAAIDPRGGEYAYTYNAINQLLEVAGPEWTSPKTLLTYDDLGNVCERQVENLDAGGAFDPLNPLVISKWNFDDGNRLASYEREISATAIATRQYLYWPSGRRREVIDADGQRTVTTFDERGLVHSVSAAAGTADESTTTFDYDARENLTRSVDASGREVTLLHDHLGRPVRRTQPDGRREESTFDLDDHLILLESKTAGGSTLRRSTWQYSPRGQLLTARRHLLNPQGGTASYLQESLTYGLDGELVSRTGPTGTPRTFVHDRAGRLTQFQNEIGDVWQFDRDEAGNPTREIGALANASTGQPDLVVREWEYDALDRPTELVLKDAAGTVQSTRTWTLDGHGRVVSWVDPEGNTGARSYNAAGWLLSESRDLRAGGTGAGAVTSTITIAFTYDLCGRVVGASDGQGGTTVLSHDNLGRVVTSVDPLGRVRSATYDPAGNVVLAVDPNGTTTQNTYDSMNRVIARTVTPGLGVLGTTSETFAYDALGRMVAASDDDSALQLMYDSLDRIVAEAQDTNPSTTPATFTYQFDADGHLSQVTYPDATVESRTHDALGRLVATSSGGSSLATYTWCGHGPVVENLPGGVTGVCAYDDLGRSSDVQWTTSSQTLAQFEYRHNMMGVRLLEKRHHSGGLGDNYHWDSTYRIVRAKSGVADPLLELATPGSQTFATDVGVAYTGTGSRAQVVTTVGSVSTTDIYASNARCEYTAVGAVAHAHDLNGNLSDDGVYLYDYDYRNQLVRIRAKSTGAVIAEYEHDAFGRRCTKTTTAGTLHFLWQGTALAMEIDASGTVSRRHLGAIPGRVAVAFQRDVLDFDGDSNTAELLPMVPLYDGAHNCVALTKPDGTLLERYEHTFDGRPTVTDAAGTPLAASQIAWQQGFGLQYRDDESGLCYSLLRHYSPQLGRHLQADPAGSWFDAANGGNPYSYLSNGYGEGTDLLGLEATKNDTCCGPQHTAFIYDEKPFDTRDHNLEPHIPSPINQNDKGNQNHAAAVKELRAANAAAGYGEKVFKFKNNPTTGGKTRDDKGNFLGDGALETEKELLDRNRATAKDYTEWVKNVGDNGDPCLAGVVYMIHAGSGGAFPFGTIPKEEAHGTWATLPFKGLKFLISMGCYAGRTAELAGKVGDKENVVAPTETTDWSSKKETTDVDPDEKSQSGKGLTKKAKEVITKSAKK